MNNITDIFNADRIAIIGCPGSGKTTFSVSLNNILMRPLYHLDLIYWDSNWRRTEKELWINKVKEISDLPNWIIDGNYIDTLDIRLCKADIIIFFDYKPIKCLWNSVKRLFSWDNSSMKSYRKITHLPKPSLNKQWELMRLILKFKKEQRHKIYEMIHFHKKTVVFFKNKNDVIRFLNQLNSQKESCNHHSLTYIS